MEESNKAYSDQFESARSARSFFGTLCQITGGIGIGGSIIYCFVLINEYEPALVPTASGIAVSSLLGSVGTITNQAKKQSSLLEFKLSQNLNSK